MSYPSSAQNRPAHRAIARLRLEPWHTFVPLATMQMRLLIVLQIFLSVTLFGQELEYTQVSTQDSVRFVEFWNGFLNSMDKNDLAEIRSQSLDSIDCVMCVSIDNSNFLTPEDYIVPIDTFLTSSLNEIRNSQIWKAIEQGRIHVNQRNWSEYRHIILPDGYGNELVTFELWVQTWKPNEWVEGHEGQSHSFQFIEHKGEFVFFGMDAIP